MKPWDFIQRLNGPEFQSFVTELLVAEYPDFRTVDDTRGDEGCDGLADKDQIFFQIYSPQGIADEPHRQKKIKDKIGNSLRKLKQNSLPTIKHIYFIISCEPEQAINKYLIHKSKEWVSYEILVWGEAKLRTLASKYDYIAKTWEDKIVGSTDHTIIVSAEAYKASDKLGPISKLIEAVGKPWQASEITKSHTIEASFGKQTYLSIKRNANANPGLDRLEIHIEFKRDYIESSNALLKNIASPYFDEAVRLTSTEVQKVVIQIGKTVLDTISELDELIITPISGKLIDSKIKLFLNKKKLLEVEYRATLRRLSDSQFVINKTPASPTDFVFDWYLDNLDDDRTWKTHASFTTSSTNANTARNFLEFYIALHKANHIMFEFDEQNIIEFDKPAEHLNDDINWLYSLAIKICEIQDAYDLCMPSILGIVVDEILSNTIEHVHTITMHGVIRGKYKNISGTLESLNIDFFNGNPGLLDNAEYMIKQIASDYSVELLGNELHFGPALRFMKGSLSHTCITNIKTAIARNDTGPIQIEFVPNTSNEAIEFYPNYMNSIEQIMEYDPSFELDQLKELEP